MCRNPSSDPPAEIKVGRNIKKRCRNSGIGPDLMPSKDNIPRSIHAYPWYPTVFRGIPRATASLLIPTRVVFSFKHSKFNSIKSYHLQEIFGVKLENK